MQRWRLIIKLPSTSKRRRSPLLSTSNLRKAETVTCDSLYSTLSSPTQVLWKKPGSKSLEKMKLVFVATYHVNGLFVETVTDGPVPLFGPHSDTKWSEVILKDFVLCQPRRPCPRVPLPPARNSHSYGKGFLSNVGVTRYDDEHAKYEPLHSETSVYFYATAIDRKRAPPLPFPPPHYDEQVQGSLLL